MRILILCLVLLAPPVVFAQVHDEIQTPKQPRPKEKEKKLPKGTKVTCPKGWHPGVPVCDKNGCIVRCVPDSELPPQ